MSKQTVTVLDLRSLLWSAWDISKAEGKDVGIGQIMLISNIDEHEAQCKGADDLPYDTLGNYWDAMPLEFQGRQRKLFNLISHHNYDALVALRQAGDKEAFVALCMKPLTPEQVEYARINRQFTDWDDICAYFGINPDATATEPTLMVNTIEWDPDEDLDKEEAAKG